MKPDSFCIGRGNITVLTVTPGLEAHIDEAEMKERGQLSNLGEVSITSQPNPNLDFMTRQYSNLVCLLEAKRTQEGIDMATIS